MGQGSKVCALIVFGRLDELVLVGGGDFDNSIGIP